MDESLLEEMLVPLYRGPRELIGNPTRRQLDQWRHIGLRDPHCPAKRVYLATVKIGRVRHTSHEAFARFLKATN